MRWRRIGLGLLVLIVLLVAWKPSRMAMQTVVLVPSLVGAGPQPLQWLAPAPSRQQLTYRIGPSGQEELADLWLPRDASARNRVGAIVFVMGVNSVGRRYPAVERFADGMARSGIAVLIPDSSVMFAGRIEAGEVGGIVQAVELLAARPEVDPDRVGLVGLSVGGSLALVAAADQRIADRLRWVNAFGAYADARTYLAEVASRAAPGEGDTGIVPWEPAPLASEVLFRLLMELVNDLGDEELLRDRYEAAVLAGRRPTLAGVEPPATAAGRAIERLIVASGRRAALDAIDALVDRSPAGRALLAAVSPLDHLEGIRADVYVMHDHADAYVPYSHGPQLTTALRAIGRDPTFTEFRLFDHVEPKGVDLVGAAPELWKLLWHVHAVLMETL
jgi:hypothetical protein